MDLSSSGVCYDGNAKIPSGTAQLRRLAIQLIARLPHTRKPSHMDRPYPKYQRTNFTADTALLTFLELKSARKAND